MDYKLENKDAIKFVICEAKSNEEGEQKLSEYVSQQGSKLKGFYYINFYKNDVLAGAMVLGEYEGELPSSRTFRTEQYPASTYMVFEFPYSELSALEKSGFNIMDVAKNNNLKITGFPIFEFVDEAKTNVRFCCPVSER